MELYRGTVGILLFIVLLEYVQTEKRTMIVVDLGLYGRSGGWANEECENAPAGTVPYYYS
eukprot:COSAG02_NODE_2582_length_8483_cov_4.396350_3_plen_60_part_00